MLPVLIGAVVIFGGALGVMGTRAELAKWIKPKLAKALAEQWRPQAEAIEKQVMADVRELLNTVQGAFKRDLTAQVALVEEQATVALAEMNRGQDRVDARKAELERFTGELAQLEAEAGELVDEILSFAVPDAAVVGA